MHSYCWPSIVTATFNGHRNRSSVKQITIKITRHWKRYDFGECTRSWYCQTILTRYRHGIAESQKSKKNRRNTKWDSLKITALLNQLTETGNWRSDARLIQECPNAEQSVDHSFVFGAYALFSADCYSYQQYLFHWYCDEFSIFYNYTGVYAKLY